MARTKTSLGAGARLSDFLSASLLARVFPADLVNRVLDAHGCNSQRIRSFPAVAGVYYCMALNLYPEAAYEEVFAVVAQGLAWAEGKPSSTTVHKSSVSELRRKIGATPLRDLMHRACLPLARPQAHPDAFFAGCRVVAIDGSNFDIPDEVDNVAQFGYPGSRTGQAGYPQAQCAVLVECATHAILDANIGPYRAPEWELCLPLLASLKPGMLCLADRGFRGHAQWCAARASGADLLWRCASNQILPVLQPLADGSWLSALYPNDRARRRGVDGVPVRIIEYTLPQHSGSTASYRLMTSLLDPESAPALSLAALYHERWQVESVFDELKTHLLRQRRVFRSKTPELVRQEFYGWVLAHYAVRWLMHQAASEYRQSHHALSFTAHVQLVRRTQPQSGAFPPSAA
ncbi:IS4 family transposase [Paludibacterium purpuratum]|uniref:IS4 family transposase n=1 Tax=Paludibacterium purpuratum TaxID=1144873 RepID=A0A4V3DUJ1_9NEIS|nr:IS4 family transposase [Paludibacterium purpuratum]TDR73348.1 IS4 family transposase [Paludibacterium purpuratum]